MVEARGSCGALDRGVRGGSAQRASLECRQGKGCIHAGEGVVTEMGDQLYPIDQMKKHIRVTETRVLTGLEKRVTNMEVEKTKHCDVGLEWDVSV